MKRTENVPPHMTLKDIIKTIRVTRGDTLFMNTVFNIINKTREDPVFREEQQIFAELFKLNNQIPGSLTLPFVFPPLHQKHWVDYCRMKQDREVAKLKKSNPDLFDEEGNFIQPKPDNPSENPSDNPQDSVPESEIT